MNDKTEPSMSAQSLQHLNRARPWLVMPAVVLPVYLLYLAVQWPLAGNHLFGFVSFNSRFVAPGAGIPGQYVSDAYGYDGQFYFRLALDPFSTQERVHGIRFDHPPLRQQRILLGALTWLFARGDPELSAALILAINLLAITGCALAGGAILRHHGQSPWPALLLAFYPGFAVSAERFLTEPLSMALVLSSLLLLLRERVAWAGMLLALAVLARETALLVAMVMALAWLLQKSTRLRGGDWRVPGPRYWAPALAVYLAWQAWLQHAWSGVALTMTSPNALNWPFYGLATSLQRLLTQLGPMHVFFLALLFATLTWVVLAGRALRHGPRPYAWLWLAYLALATLLGPAIWDNSPGFLRITTELNMLGLLIYLLAQRKIRAWLALGWLSAWLLTAGAEAYRLHLVAPTRDHLPTPGIQAALATGPLGVGQRRQHSLAGVLQVPGRQAATGRGHGSPSIDAGVRAVIAHHDIGIRNQVGPRIVLALVVQR